MTKFVLLLPCVLLLHPQLSDCRKNRIVGDANAQNVPYQVSLRYNDQHHCSGSIIGDSWVLTAGQCVMGLDASTISVVTVDNQCNTNGNIRIAEKLILHKSKQPHSVRHDIALIQLKKPNFNMTIDKIKLPKRDVPIGTEVVLNVCDTTLPPGQTLNNIQPIKLLTISKEQCIFEHNSTDITDGNICTVSISGESACNSDSGGPLMLADEQVGIVSWGIPCAKGKPNVFTRVSYYKNWIKNNMK